VSDASNVPTVLIVPGLRGHVADHWQTLLADRLPRVRSVEPGGRDNVDCAARVAVIEQAASSIAGPILVVAHSAGVIMTVHWAHQTQRVIQGALLAVPPDLESPLPQGYPAMDALRAGGWLPIPRSPLPFNSIVIVSRNDPLAHPHRVADFARSWGSRLVDIGEVGHLNPQSGFGEWPDAMQFIRALEAEAEPDIPTENVLKSDLNKETN
jgi:predicted alpha/beta hydrolase family esterase